MINNNNNYIEQQLHHVLVHYYNLADCQIFALKSGMNNITRVVHHKQQKYNVRIYNNHRDVQKVKFEHHILLALKDVKAGVMTPIPVKTVYDDTLAKLDDGRLVALYEYIDGEQESSEKLFYSLVRAAAHLSCSLANITSDATADYSPYYDLASNYPPYTTEQIRGLFEQSLISEQTMNRLLYLNDARQLLQQQRERFIQLPHQLIHGDINFSNAVTSGAEVIAILDFEFITYDLRVMELAVLFTEFFKISPSFNRTHYEHVINVFLEHVNLTEQEIELLPQFIKLRSVDVAIHFITRYFSGLDSEEVLTKIVDDCYSVAHSIDINLC